MPSPNHVQVIRQGLLTIHTLDGTDVDAVVNAVESRGEILKSSHKSLTRRVGDWVVKTSRFNSGIGPLKHTLRRQRYRQAWNAARHLQAHGVPVATPRAFVETSALGLIFGNTLVTDYLEGYSSIEEYLPALKQDADDAGIENFLSRLAEALRGIERADAVQEDFTGADILTRNGEDVFFIDLDAVRLGVPYTDDLRALNHAQLWFSMRHACTEEQIRHFLDVLKPSAPSLDEWMEIVRVKFDQRVAHANAVVAARAAQK
ncbi:MAG: hypothetical protein IID08_02205 [Candidatus Hydrogenedentes bacterium]|nr:hypothetical protein [Candidatus Hydrogenedentota bacterium]